MPDGTEGFEPRAIRIVEDRWTTVRHGVEALAIVAAGVWAFYTFIYQERIKPANEPAALDLSVSVQRLGRDARREILEVTVHMHNAGKTEIDIAADAYNVWGERFADRERVVSRHGSAQSGYANSLPEVSERAIDAFAELRDAASGGRVGTHIILEPGANEDLGDVFAIRRGEYDLIHAQGIAVPVKTGSRAKVNVRVLRNRNGGFWLSVPDVDVDEDDNDTDFALIP
jgi:hypothetical protein